ncbi:SDR family NAD(P)-dependent oxidoreductase [Microbaculum marinum]|uniref:SDR family oxidoreductase n=1 Tax=Microbaculum marinum TaxID=1764581 RepID=A0AAW9RZW3_9HYPH
MDFQLGGRVALVTGATSGVGRAIAQTLAREGASVAVNYNSSADAANAIVREIEEAGGKAKAYRADVSDWAAVQSGVGKIVEDFGSLDILINNAGFVERKAFESTTPEDWQKQIGSCLYGAVHCCHAAAPHLKKSGHGRIVGLIGDSSRVGESGLALAAAARAGAVGLIKSLAREMGRYGVTANAISLGLVETGHGQEWLDANREKLVKFYPTRRLGKADDVPPLVALLASDSGSWITGQTISVSGGYCMV